MVVPLGDTQVHCPCFFLTVLCDSHSSVNLRRHSWVEPLQPPTDYFLCEPPNLASRMSVQSPFHLVQSTVCTGFKLVAQMNVPLHAKGQKGTERAVLLWSAWRERCRHAYSATCPCWRWLCSGSTAVHCSAVGVASPRPIPRPSVDTAETGPP